MSSRARRVPFTIKSTEYVPGATALPRVKRLVSTAVPESPRRYVLSKLTSSTAPLWLCGVTATSATAWGIAAHAIIEKAIAANGFRRSRNESVPERWEAY